MKRVITAIILLAIFLPVLIFSDTIIFPIAISLLGGIAAFEILYIRNLHKKLYILVPTVLFVMFCPFVSGTEFFKVFTSKSYNFLVVAFPAYMIYLLFVAITFNRKIEFSDIAYTFIGIFYVALSVFAVPFIRKGAPIAYLLLIFCPCATDIFALYGGKFFGKKKLCPAVSRHKTIAGAISGVIGSVVITMGYGAIRYFFMDAQPRFLLLALAGVGISVVGQYGDLVASLLKRNCGVKDFGNIIPGHGGVMDRFDSILASFSCAFIFLTAYNKIFLLF